MQKTKQHNPEQGSIFFYLLIGAALIALLSIVIANGGNWGQDKVSDDKAKLIAAEILSQMNAMKEAVDRTTLKGATWATVSLENPIVTGYKNTNCTQPSCKVFDMGGGGVEWMFPPAGASNSNYQYFFSEETIIYSMGNDRNDMIVYLFDVPDNVCRAFNSITQNLSLSTPIQNVAGTFWVHNLYKGTPSSAGAYPDLKITHGCKNFDSVVSRYSTPTAPAPTLATIGPQNAIWGLLRINKD